MAHQQHHNTDTTNVSTPELQSAFTSTSSTNPSPTKESEQPAVRRTLKNEDSSYDSDFESSEITGQSSGPDQQQQQEEEHENVCRTVSETLGAEFAEYVTAQPNTTTPNVVGACIQPTEDATNTGNFKTSKPGEIVTSTTNVVVPEASKVVVTYTISSSISKSSNVNAILKAPLTSTVSLPAVSHPLLRSKNSTPAGFYSPVPRPSSVPLHPELCKTSSVTAINTNTVLYQQQVEFGIKRGYSENLVQLALEKLGSTPANNELLDELIRLEAGVPKAESNESASATSIDRKDKESVDPSYYLKTIIIDGSNIAKSHGNQNVFSCRGIQLCVDWFRARGHQEITVFVPLYRKEASKWDNKITDQEILSELEEQKVLVFTPSRTTHASGRRIVPYDDRYILKEAIHSGGVVVSNDNFRDLAVENVDFKRVVEKDILIYSWVNGRFVPPDDPLGRNGPTLDVFLRKPLLNSVGSSNQQRDMKPCPYGRKCTYGNKCKYQHPERGALPVKSVTEILQAQRDSFYQDKAKSRESSPGDSLRAKLSLPAGGLSATDSRQNLLSQKKPLSRTQSFSATGTHVHMPSNLLHDTSSHDRPSHCPPHTSPEHAILSAQTSYEQQYTRNYTMYPQHQMLQRQPPHMHWTTSRPPYPPPKHSEETLSHSDNPHPILERQLTLNPTNDRRLDKMVTKYASNQKSLPVMGNQYQSFQTPHRPYQQMLHMQHYGNTDENAVCNIPGFTYRNAEPQQEVSKGNVNQQQQPVASSLSHPHVARFSSAPDPVWGGASSSSQLQVGSGIPQISRLNSISDPYLNVYLPSEEQYPLPVAATRPLSPQQQLARPLQHLSSMHAYPPPPKPTGNEEERSRLYYHLTNLFPEKEVLAALAKHPNETDAKKLCQSILLATHTTEPASSSVMPHEDSRLRDYLNPQSHYQQPSSDKS